MSTTALLLQLIVILVTARVCGWSLKFLGQPRVVGEMTAGLVMARVTTAMTGPLVTLFVGKPLALVGAVKAGALAKS